MPDDRRATAGTNLLTLRRAVRATTSSSPRTSRWRSPHPAWRAPIHKGDRIRITGLYENKDHAWYTVMTHEGIYIDRAGSRRSAAASPTWSAGPGAEGHVRQAQGEGRVKKRVKVSSEHGAKVRYGAPRAASACARRSQARSRHRRQVRQEAPAGHAAGPDRRRHATARSATHADRVCGAEYGAAPCDRPGGRAPAGAVHQRR